MAKAAAGEASKRGPSGSGVASLAMRFWEKHPSTRKSGAPPIPRCRWRAVPSTSRYSNQTGVSRKGPIHGTTQC